jgi:diguanylate cyclase (GGDEF)-like protein
LIRPLLTSPDFLEGGKITPSDQPQSALSRAAYLLPDSTSNWGCAMLLCLAACWGGVVLGQTSAEAAILWPANGLVLGFLLVTPRRNWFSYLMGCVIANLLIHIIFPFPPDKSILFSLANIVEIFFAAECLAPRGDGNLDFIDLLSVGRFFVFAVILAPLVSSLFIVAGLIILGLHPDWISLINWYSGDAIGMAVMTPLVLVVDRREMFRLWGPIKRWEAAGLLLALLLLSAFIFARGTLPLFFLLFPALLVICFHLRTTGVALGAFLMVVPAAYFTALGLGPFSPSITGSLLHSIWVLQCFLSVALVSIYSVASALARRDQTLREIFEAFRQADVHADTDYLTGLPNRRAFDNQLVKEWRRALRDHVGISLMMIDVDLFKTFNDHYGHIAGDKCLYAVASLLREAPLRGTDMAARYGGEEFVVILPGAGEDGAALIANRIRDAVVDRLIPHVANPAGFVTVSIGVATMHPALLVEQGNLRLDLHVELIRRADQALYAAKQDGRNQVKVWHQPAKLKSDQEA